MKNKNKMKFAQGTKEWASSTLNIQTGCENDCKYCYAKCKAVRFKRATPESWGSKIVPHKSAASCRKLKGRVMFPSTHDIMPDNIDACLVTIKELLQAGHSLLIVSKPRLGCIKQLCAELEPYKAQILFRFTMGSADDTVLKYWEPGAPGFAERLLALAYAYGQGFSTSVSMEPMLDFDPGAVIAAVRPFVTDKIWLGKINRLRQILAVNCPGDRDALKRADALIASQDDAYINRLYMTYKGDPLIAWKDSIKKVVGIDRPTVAGLDI